MYSYIYSKFHSVLNSILDIIFPRLCLGCKSQQTLLCPGCLEKAPHPNANLPPWIKALYSYKYPIIKNSIWQLKYQYAYGLGRIYGEILYDAISEDLARDPRLRNLPLYIVPIPVTSKRKRERGYNQAGLISHALLSCDVSHTYKDGSRFLKRLEMELRQSHTKNKIERIRNIKGSFILGEPLPANSHFLLIDDVVTTGATLEEARRVLLLGGASYVSAYAIAH